MENEKSSRSLRTPIIVVASCILMLLLVILIFSHKTHSKPAHQTQDAFSPNMQKSTRTMEQHNQLPQITVIALTAGGFFPTKIAVKTDTAVTWKNNSSTDNASVNSDDFPTNQRFPELNLGKFSRGQALTHLFTAPGVYTYHNQFNPKQTGTIIVK